MAYQTKVVGYKELTAKLQKIAWQVRPQVGLADSLEDGAWVIAMAAKDNAIRHGLFLSGALVDSIAPVKVNQFRVDVRVGVPYGAIHEFGYENIKITARQRKFFWAKYYETGGDEGGDPMWKALALSDTYSMPAKPYLRPAIDERKQVALQAIGDSVRAKVEKVARE